MTFLELFEVAGQIAGIGGLTVVVLLLIYRQVLLTVKQPKVMPAGGYLKLVNNLILYVFIVTVIGLVVYALLYLVRTTERALTKAAELEGKFIQLQNDHTQMSGDTKKLSDRLSKIEEAELKERTLGIEMLQQDTSFDLTAWKAADSNQLIKDKLYPIITRKRYKLVRAFPETKNFVSTFGTSSPFDPIFNCETHTCKSNKNSDIVPPGKPSLRRWILDFDISSEPLFTPFAIVQATTVYNSFGNQQRESCGTLITTPTESASIEVLFPKTKLPNPDSLTYTCYPLGVGAPPQVVDDRDSRFDEKLGMLVWQISEPRLAFHYQVEWTW